MLTISVWPRRLKEFLLTHPLYKSPRIPAARSGYPTSLFAAKVLHPTITNSSQRGGILCEKCENQMPCNSARKASADSTRTRGNGMSFRMSK